MMMMGQVQQQGAAPPSVGGGFPMQQARPWQQQQPDLAQQQQLASFLAQQYAASMAGQRPAAPHAWGFGGGVRVNPRCQDVMLNAGCCGSALRSSGVCAAQLTEQPTSCPTPVLSC